MMESRRKSVLVVGASSGIGFALALEFSKRGYLVFAGSRNVKRMEPLTDAGIITFQLDVTCPESIEGAKRVVDKKCGGLLDVLYLNAGVSKKGTLLDVSMAVLESSFKTNVFGPILVLQTFQDLLLKSSGTVVFTSSVSVLGNIPFLFPYIASKTSFDIMARQLAMETSALGIKVVNVRTGVVESDIWDGELYTPPSTSVYEMNGKAIEKSMADGPKLPAPIYAKDVVSDVEAAMNGRSAYTQVYRGGKTFVAWILGKLPFSVYIPLVHKVLNLGDIFANARKNITEL